MKKNQKGFLLAETLIVSTFISIILIYLFVQFRNINTNYEKTLKYNGVNEIHLLKQVKKYLEENDLENFSSKVSFENNKYLLLNECSSELFDDVNYCSTLFEDLNAVNVVYMSSNDIINSETFSQGFNDYLNTIKTIDGMYVIAAEFDNDSYASLLVNAHQLKELETAIKNQPVYYDVSSGAGLYYDDTISSNTAYVFKSDSRNNINNNIELFGYSGKIISIDNQGVKVYFDLRKNISYDESQSYFTSTNILSSGMYENTSVGNSTLFQILNSIDIENNDILKPNVSYSVGKVDSVIGNNLKNIINSENSVKFRSNDSTKFIATITISDLIRSSLNSSCNHNNISNNCLLNNWLSENVWTMNYSSESSVWGTNNNSFNSFQVGSSIIKNAYAVVYVDGSLKVSGDGSEENPYRF